MPQFMYLPLVYRMLNMDPRRSATPRPVRPVPPVAPTPAGDGADEEMLELVDGPAEPQAWIGAAVPGGGDRGAPPVPSIPAPAAPLLRDRIVILGRRRAGKTIFLARLYEALWQGCVLLDGQLLPPSEPTAGRRVTRMSCRSTTGTAHAQFMRTAEELRRGKWPAATAGNSYAEIVVSNGGREHTVTALDYPGEVFRKAFTADSTDPDALELRNAVDRAAAAILLIDPSVVAAGGEEAQEDVFGLTNAALRIRQSEGGALVPIAIVFTKCDSNAPFLREAGGVRAFAAKHFGPLLREVDRTSVFACAAVRVTTNALGKQVPQAERPAENVVEPVRYCLSIIERGVDVKRVETARSERDAAHRAAEADEVAERKRSAMAWLVFGVAVAMLLVSVAVATFWFVMRG